MEKRIIIKEKFIRVRYRHLGTEKPEDCEELFLKTSINRVRKTCDNELSWKYYIETNMFSVNYPYKKDRDEDFEKLAKMFD